jgi:hypothetical protein
MNQFKFAEGLKVLPILAPADIVAAATASQYVNISKANWATFVVQFGALTASTGTITVEASTAGSSNSGEAAIPFKYRLSSAVGTDSLGAITAASSAGASIAATDDNKVLVIDVDPAALPANPGADYKYLRVVVTPASDNTAYVVGAVAYLHPRYPGNSISSAT